MADRDDIYRWLQGASFRHTPLSLRPMIEGLISEGRAEWVNPWNRARAIPNPPPKPNTKRAELAALHELARQAERYHVDCGHDCEGAAAQCDAICAAWKAWKAIASQPSSDPKGDR